MMTNEQSRRHWYATHETARDVPFVATLRVVDKDPVPEDDHADTDDLILLQEDPNDVWILVPYLMIGAGVAALIGIIAYVAWRAL